jgi:hypothetical protein
VVGSIEILAVVFLYFKKLRFPALAILAATMIGAIATHILNDEISRVVHNLAIIAILLAIYHLNPANEPLASVNS